MRGSSRSCLGVKGIRREFRWCLIAAGVHHRGWDIGVDALQRGMGWGGFAKSALRVSVHRHVEGGRKSSGAVWKVGILHWVEDAWSRRTVKVTSVNAVV